MRSIVLIDPAKTYLLYILFFVVIHYEVFESLSRHYFWLIHLKSLFDEVFLSFKRQFRVIESVCILKKNLIKIFFRNNKIMIQNIKLNASNIVVGIAIPINFMNVTVEFISLLFWQSTDCAINSIIHVDPIAISEGLGHFHDIIQFIT